MNELKQFKEKTLKKFDKQFMLEGGYVDADCLGELENFISDLIDEMIELNHPFFKADMETGEITELEPGVIKPLH